MPEGHTLRRLANQLNEAFAGHRVRASSPQGRFAASAALIDGERLELADSWGKHLFITFPGERFVHVHLGLYGKFAVHRQAAEVQPPVGQVRLRLVRADEGAYADLRGATACSLMTREERDAVIARIGPDPLRDDADPMLAWQRIFRSRAPLGGLLMDQSVLAGVGNVYRAEILFRHRIHPMRAGQTLRIGQWQAMWQGVRTGRIDAVRPEHTATAMGRPRPERGGEVYVYRRTGQPCLVCERKVRTAVLAQRNLFWCSRCQPVFGSRALKRGAGLLKRGPDEQP